MSYKFEFWEADGSGEALIRDVRCKLLEGLAEAACARPARCVLVTLSRTDATERETIIWKRPGYHSSCMHAQTEGLLNIWAKHI